MDFKKIYNLSLEDYIASFGDNEAVKKYIKEMYGIVKED